MPEVDTYALQYEPRHSLLYTTSCFYSVDTGIAARSKFRQLPHGDTILYCGAMHGPMHSCPYNAAWLHVICNALLQYNVHMCTAENMKHI